MGEPVDVVVIGAGVVGLAVARRLALAGRDVIVVERHAEFGAETSSRNSEVIHAGIYYRKGGFRARFCVAGKKMLYAYCREHHVPYLNCEKLVVACDEEEATGLDHIISLSENNGVHDLYKISGAEARKLEPGLGCVGAIVSPSTGIVDSHALMLSLIGELEDAGGVLSLSTPLLSGKIVDGGVDLEIGGDDPISLTAKLVINSAGLAAEKVGRSIAGLDAAKIPPVRPAKGQYFVYSGKAPFSRLIYPMPEPDSLGVHYTRDLGGQGRLGPDISWDAPFYDYAVDERARDRFYDAAKKFWPDLERDRLQPGYAGQRPKTTGPGEEGDFKIFGPNEHGSPGYIGLYGIESPGLTSCLAIADYVLAMA